MSKSTSSGATLIFFPRLNGFFSPSLLFSSRFLLFISSRRRRWKRRFPFLMPLHCGAFIQSLVNAIEIVVPTCRLILYSFSFLFFLFFLCSGSQIRQAKSTVHRTPAGAMLRAKKQARRGEHEQRLVRRLMLHGCLRKIILIG